MNYFLLIILFRVIISQPNSSKIKEIICGTEICHPEGGYCNNEYKCICNPGYTTFSPIILPNAEHKVNCNYKQKSDLKAGLLEMIFGCGLGHFYAGRKINGSIKLFCVLILCTCCCVTLVMMKKISQESQAEYHTFTSLLFLLSIVYTICLILWQFIDGILFFFGVYNDGNGIELY
jgi:hypothetical protein